MMKKVCLVGASIILDSSFLHERKKDCFLVACDGGYKHFLKEKIEPDLLVGDFDTFKSEQIQNPKEVIRLNPVKDDTDTFHALEVLLKEGYDTFYLYGCLGGRIEHTIANIQVLSYLLDHKARGFLYSEDLKSVVALLENGTLKFEKGHFGLVSVFSYRGTCKGVTEEGLKYSLKDYDMDDSLPTLGVSNELLGEAASISVREGRLLVVAPSDSHHQE